MTKKWSDLDKLVISYLTSKKTIDEFLENIESTDIDVTPQGSPKPTKKDDEDENIDD